MIFDIYQHLKEKHSGNKLVGSDYLIMEYKCPIETDQFQWMTELHFITFLITGRKDWITPGKTFKTKEGDAIFLRKGVYTTHQYLDVDNCVLTLFMSDDFIRNFLRENNFIFPADSDESEQDQIFELDVNDTLKSLFYSVYNYLKMKPEIPRSLVEIKFKELLFNIVLNPKHKKLKQFFASLNQTGKSNLDAVMMKNFRHDLELEEFARLSGRSLSAFKRDFQKFYRQTPGQWLKDKRLEYATTLLLSSDLNVNEICYESGFRNSSHFNKAFKDKYHLPPNQFREHNKLAEPTLSGVSFQE